MHFSILGPVKPRDRHAPAPFVRDFSRQGSCFQLTNVWENLRPPRRSFFSIFSSQYVQVAACVEVIRCYAFQQKPFHMAQQLPIWLCTRHKLPAHTQRLPRPSELACQRWRLRTARSAWTATAARLKCVACEACEAL